MIDQFAKVITDMLRKDMNNLADDLASGKARTMEDYRFTCGLIRGLATAEEYVKDLAARAEKEE